MSLAGEIIQNFQKEVKIKTCQMLVAFHDKHNEREVWQELASLVGWSGVAHQWGLRKSSGDGASPRRDRFSRGGGGTCFCSDDYNWSGRGWNCSVGVDAMGPAVDGLVADRSGSYYEYC